MRNAFFLLAGLLLFSSCEKMEETPLEGHYSGTFARSGPTTSNLAFSRVSLHINGTTYAGSSDTRNYPFICSGTFHLTDSVLQIQNNCPYTTDFDGTLVFHGNYKYALKGDSLSIWRDYSNGEKDQYLLVR